MDKFYLIVDGSNVAFYKRTAKKKAKFANLEIIKKFLENISKEFPIFWEILVDASLQYRIDDRDALEKSIKKGKISQCPDKIEADNFILEFHNRHPQNTLIISNDNFKEYEDKDGIKIFKFMILFDEIIISPDIDEYLKQIIPSSEEVKANV